MNKFILLFGSLISLSVIAQPMVLDKDSLKCKGDKDSISHHIVVDLPQECLQNVESGFTNLWGLIEKKSELFKKDISFKIQGHNIVCWPIDTKPQRINKLSFSLPEELRIKTRYGTIGGNQMSNYGSVFENGATTLRDHRKSSNAQYGDSSTGQNLKYTLKYENGELTPKLKDSYLKGDEDFASYTDEQTQKYHLYIDSSDEKNLSKIKVNTQLNKVSNVNCNKDDDLKNGISSESIDKERGNINSLDKTESSKQ